MQRKVMQTLPGPDPGKRGTTRARVTRVRAVLASPGKTGRHTSCPSTALFPVATGRERCTPGLTSTGGSARSSGPTCARVQRRCLTRRPPQGRQSCGCTDHFPSTSAPPSRPKSPQPPSPPPDLGHPVVPLPAKRSTLGMKAFHVDQEPAFQAFVEHLRRWDGGGRGKTAARSIVKDLSKRISPGKADFMVLADTDKVQEYLEHIKNEQRCLAHGLCTKLQNVLTGLKYARLRLANPDDRTRVQGAIERCTGWMPVLRREKSHLTSLTQQEKVDGGELLQVQQFFKKVTDKAQHLLVKTLSHPLTPQKKQIVLGVLMGTLTYSNFQRSGAICNATLAEFRDAVAVTTLTGARSYVIKVKRHKAMREGPTQMVMSKADRTMIWKYVERVRNCGEAAVGVEELLLYSDKPFTRPYFFLKKAAEACGVEAPTPTWVRMAAETKSLKTLSVRSQALLSAHLTHTPKMATLHYHRIHGVEDPVKAHGLRKALTGLAPMQGRIILL